MPKLNILHASPSSTIWLMGYYFNEVPMGWWWSVSLDRNTFNCSGIFTPAYVDHTHHGVPSSGKPLDMVSICPQSRMTRCRLSPCAGIVSFSRSKLWSMQILFSLSIYLGLSQSWELTLWVPCSGHQEDSYSYLSPQTHLPSGWKLCQ
jgi:hypothetical protein